MYELFSAEYGWKDSYTRSLSGTQIRLRLERLIDRKLIESGAKKRKRSLKSAPKMSDKDLDKLF